MNPTQVSTEHISINPEIRFGKPCITGTRIAVIDIATRASVHAAMAYYYDHREEIEIRKGESEAFAQEFAQNHPSLLQERFRKLKGE